MAIVQEQKSKTLDLNYRIPQVVIAPLEGNSAQEIYEAVPESLRVNTRHNERIKGVIGSTNLLVVGLDNIVQPHGLRALNLSDLSLPEVMAFAKGHHYIDARTLIARSAKDSYEPNNFLLKRICELVEEKEGSVKFPFMIEGFNYKEVSENTDYGVTILSDDDFTVIQDERLKGEYDRRKFSEVDEFGLPKFDKKGNRIWYARDEGLSRVYLTRDLDLYSYDRDLFYSYDYGRVVVRSAEGADAQNFVQERLKQLKEIRDTQIAEANKNYERAEGMMLDNSK